MRRWLPLILVAGLGATAQFQPPSPDWSGFEERTELAEAGPLDGARRVLRFVQFSDAHILDDDAPYPLRQEPLDGLGDPFSGAQRPQEEYTDEGLDAMVRAINAVHGADRLDFVLSTGDNTDNALENELMRFIDNLEGTLTTKGPISGLECLPDGQSRDVDDTSSDQAERCTHLPEALAAANTPLAAGLPWFSALGEHDALIQGNAPVGPASDALAAQHGRQFLRQHEHVAMHFAAATPCLGGVPMGSVRDDHGHGYGFAGARLCDDDPDNDGYYAFTARGVRFIVLDTVNDDFVAANQHLAGTPDPQAVIGDDLAGGSDGALDGAQFAWLMDEVAAHTDKLVVVASHHTINSMVGSAAQGECTAAGCAHEVLGQAGYITGPELTAALAQHPHVVAWIGGHTHQHRIEPKGDAFWNIETSSLIDMPQEARLIEVWVTADGTKGFLALSRIGHDYEASRELAAADPQGVDGAGGPLDQDVLLWFDVPPGIAPVPQPELPRVLVTRLVEPAGGGLHGMAGEAVNVTLRVEDSILRVPVAGLSVNVSIARADPAAPTGVSFVATARLEGAGGEYRFTFTPEVARVHYLDFAVTDPSGAYPSASRVVSLDIGGADEEVKARKSPLPLALVLMGLALALRRR